MLLIKNFLFKIFCFIIALVFNSVAIAADKIVVTDEAMAKTTNPITKVKIGMYIADISNINLLEGRFVIDFYLSLKCNPDCSNLNFHLVNGRILSQEMFYETKNEKQYKIDAEVDSPFNFYKYPFDTQQLNIIFEDKLLDNKQIQFIVDPLKTDVAKEVVLLGWESSPHWKANIIDYIYPIYDQTYSRYIFTMTVEHPILAGLIKMIIPGIFIMLVAFLTLLVKVRQIINGFTLASGTLVSMILLHLSIISSLPSLRYVIFIDSFMLINYFCLVVVLIQLVVLMREPERLSNSLERNFLYMSSLLWLTMQFINVYLFFIT